MPTPNTLQQPPPRTAPPIAQRKKSYLTNGPLAKPISWCAVLLRGRPHRVYAFPCPAEPGPTGNPPLSNPFLTLTPRGIRLSELSRPSRGRSVQGMDATKTWSFPFGDVEDAHCWDPWPGGMEAQIVMLRETLVNAHPLPLEPLGSWRSKGRPQSDLPGVCPTTGQGERPSASLILAYHDLTQPFDPYGDPVSGRIRPALSGPLCRDLTHPQPSVPRDEEEAGKLEPPFSRKGSHLFPCEKQTRNGPIDMRPPYMSLRS